MGSHKELKQKRTVTLNHAHFENELANHR